MTSTDPMFDPTDIDEPDYYCVHGTFIGNPYGADYMCGWCESGASLDEYNAYLAASRARRSRQRLAHMLFDHLWANPMPANPPAIAMDIVMHFGRLAHDA